jgi:hypothetical protein
LFGEAKLAQHSQEEGRKICWNEAKSFRFSQTAHTGNNNESARVSMVSHPVSQPSLHISAIWNTIVEEEVSKIKLRPFYIAWVCSVFMLVLLKRCIYVISILVYLLLCILSYLFSVNK